MAAAAGTAAERGLETKRVAGQFECHWRVVDIDCVLAACGTLTDENAEHPICHDGPKAVVRTCLPKPLFRKSRWVTTFSMSPYGLPPRVRFGTTTIVQEAIKALALSATMIALAFVCFEPLEDVIGQLEAWLLVTFHQMLIEFY
jgi:hypothetical protein